MLLPQSLGDGTRVNAEGIPRVGHQLKAMMIDFRDIIA